MSYLVPINESLNSSTDTQKKDLVSKGTDTNNLCSCTYTKYLITSNDDSKKNFEKTIKRKLKSKEQGQINIKNIDILKKQYNCNYVNQNNYFNKYHMNNYNQEPLLISLRKQDGFFSNVTRGNQEKHKLTQSNIQLFKHSNLNCNWGNNYDSNNNSKQLQIQKQNQVLLSIKHYSEIKINSTDNLNNIIGSNCSSNGLIIQSKAKQTGSLCINNFNDNSVLNDLSNERERGQKQYKKVCFAKTDSLINDKFLTNISSFNKENNCQRLLSNSLSKNDGDYSLVEVKKHLRCPNINKSQIISPNNLERSHVFPQLHLDIKHKKSEMNGNYQIKNIKTFLRSNNHWNNKVNNYLRLFNNKDMSINQSPSCLRKYLFNIKCKNKKNILITNTSFKRNFPFLFPSNKVNVKLLKSPSCFSINEQYNPLTNNSVKHLTFQIPIEYKRIISKSP